MDKKIIINFYRKSILIEVTIFRYRFLSIDIRNRYSSMIDIDYYEVLPIIGLSINYVWYRVYFYQPHSFSLFTNTNNATGLLKGARNSGS